MSFKLFTVFILSVIAVSCSTETFQLEVILGPEASNLVVGHVTINIPQGTFSSYATHHITFSTEHTNTTDSHEVYKDKRSHSAACPYVWMTWCHLGGNTTFLSWTVEEGGSSGNSARHLPNLRFNKPVTIHYGIREPVSDSGELWVGVDTESPISTGLLPAKCNKKGLGVNSTELVFDIKGVGTYSVAKLPYVQPANTCQKCQSAMPACLNSLASTFSVSTVCSLSSSLLDVACLFPTFRSTSTCDLLCQKGEVEELINPLLDVLCKGSNTTHLQLGDDLCRYYQKC